MKNDLFTSILAAIAGVLIGYFVCNMFIGEIESVTYKTVDPSNIGADIADPDPEVFNYRALNPTVEVYVGECEQYGENGECVVVENPEEEQNPENP